MLEPLQQVEREGDDLSRLLEGYRFRVCEHAGAAAAALDIRRQVYIDGAGYDVPVPDSYDARSWFLLAEEASTGAPVGSMRLTPRLAGPLEVERYFTLPQPLRVPQAVELNRFAILPAHRKGKTFLPVVSLGLFKLVHSFLSSLGSEYMIIASKPERVWTYEWMRFQSAGQRAPYGQLDGAEHELLWYDFQNAPEILEGHPFRGFFVEAHYREVVLPRRVPPLGLGVGVATGLDLRAVA